MLRLRCLIILAILACAACDRPPPWRALSESYTLQIPTSQVERFADALQTINRGEARTHINFNTFNPPVPSTVSTNTQRYEYALDDSRRKALAIAVHEHTTIAAVCAVSEVAGGVPVGAALRGKEMAEHVMVQADGNAPVTLFVLYAAGGACAQAEHRDIFVAGFSAAATPAPAALTPFINANVSFNISTSESDSRPAFEHLRSEVRAIVLEYAKHGTLRFESENF